ncbi:MAG: flagellin, partial [Pseudomonadota bacterium]
VQIAGVDDLSATRVATNANVVGVAEQFQRFDVTVGAVTTGQTVSFEVNGQTVSYTATTALASAVVASALVSAFNAIAVVTATAAAVRTANTIIITSDSSSANITVNNPGGTVPPGIAQTQANVQPVAVQAQVDTFNFAGTAEQGEVVNLNINGTDYQYRIQDGDTLQNALNQLAVIANADSAVTVAATATSLVVTAVTAGTAFSAAAGTQNLDSVFDVTLSNGTASVTKRVTGDGIQAVRFDAPNAQVDVISMVNTNDVLTSGQTASVTLGATTVTVTAGTAGLSANATISALVVAINASAVGTAVTASVGTDGISIILTSSTPGTANPALSGLTAGTMDFSAETISPNVITPFGDGVTGVTLNLSMEELVLAARGDATNGPWNAKFDLRGAQTGREEQLRSTELIPGSTANNLRVQFNERNTSDILVESVNIQTNGQGLRLDYAANAWRDLADIDEAFDDLDYARSRLRSAAASFGTNLNIITTREVFTVEFTNVLTEGADKLVLADQNEEGATLLTLQTRQQLGTISLSIANESQQAILRLF